MFSVDMGHNFFDKFFLDFFMFYVYNSQRSLSESRWFVLFKLFLF